MTTALQGQAESDQAARVPVLGEGFQEGGSVAGSRDINSSADSTDPAKSGKQQLRKPGKKQGEGNEPAADTAEDDMTTAAAPIAVGGLRSTSPIPRATSPKAVPTSPGQVQQSPRVASPASSQIFERDVQEEIATATSPAIPSHIATENHIPPVLESASQAITDETLDPDAVEIVTHVAHQPASAVVAGSTTDLPLTPLHPVTSSVSDSAPMLSSQDSGSIPPLASSILAGRASPPAASEAGTNPASDDGNAAPTYASLDSNDVRRLSFISFADVVHAEHMPGGDNASLRESLLASPNPAAAAASPLHGAARSPSPMRSPVSPSLSAASGGVPQFVDIEGSPARPAVGLGVGSSPPNGPVASGELAIETMGQALRNTTSGDLSGARSSVIFTDDGEEKR